LSLRGKDRAFSYETALSGLKNVCGSIDGALLYRTALLTAPLLLAGLMENLRARSPGGRFFLSSLK